MPDRSESAFSPAPTDQHSTKPWWRSAAVYQIYPRSFADGNGDGTGDLEGLISRVPYLARLGIDAVWLNPWYRSPLLDGGYDVADYIDIDPRYGTLATAEAFIAEAHAHDIRVLVDLVPNHTSWEHAWFKEALAAPPGDPARDRFIFRDGRGPGGAEPPTNWQSMFRGPAWERTPDGQWYLHLFDVSQPDLNWDNPEVAAEFHRILRFWLDRGVDGFRVDVAHGLVKDAAFPDVAPDDDVLRHLTELIDHPFWDRDALHGVIRSWRSVLDEYDDRMMVAEACVHPERLPLYLRPDEYHQSFNFELIEAPWDAGVFARVIEDSHARAIAVGAISTWVLSNHDVMRHATRYGLPAEVDWRRWPATGPFDVLDAALGARRARAAALITLSLPGSVYIYQGEELGLPEVWDLPDEVIEDPNFERSGGAERGRDGCRVPIPWTPDGPSYGFGSGAPWLPQPEVFGRLAVSEQEHDPDSMLSLYRTALALRRELLAADERLEMLDLGVDVLAYRRGDDLSLVANMGRDPIPLPPGDVVLASNDLGQGHVVPPDTAVWIRSCR